jgi:hypothetical protein
MGSEIAADHHPIRLSYQPPHSSTFLSEQTSHQKSANSTFLSEQISHRSNEQAACHRRSIGVGRASLLTARFRCFTSQRLKWQHESLVPERRRHCTAHLFFCLALQSDDAVASTTAGYPHQWIALLKLQFQVSSPLTSSGMVARLAVHPRQISKTVRRT